MAPQPKTIQKHEGIVAHCLSLCRIWNGLSLLRSVVNAFTSNIILTENKYSFVITVKPVSPVGRDAWFPMDFLTTELFVSRYVSQRISKVSHKCIYVLDGDRQSVKLCVPYIKIHYKTRHIGRTYIKKPVVSSQLQLKNFRLNKSRFIVPFGEFVMGSQLPSSLNKYLHKKTTSMDL